MFYGHLSKIVTFSIAIKIGDIIMLFYFSNFYARSRDQISVYNRSDIIQYFIFKKITKLPAQCPISNLRLPRLVWPVSKFNLFEFIWIYLILCFSLVVDARVSIVTAARLVDIKVAGSVRGSEYKTESKIEDKQPKPIPDMYTKTTSDSASTGEKEEQL